MNDTTEPTGLVIQDPDACAMADELMALTGLGLQAAVVTALSAAIEQAERRARYHDRIMCITREIAGGSRHR